MDAHKDGFLILGTALISLSIYGCYRFIQQGREIVKSKNKLIELAANQNQIDFKKIKRQKLQENVILSQVYSKQQKESIRIFERQVSVYNLMRLNREYYQYIPGKPFTFKNNGQNITCQMNSTTISDKVLSYIGTPDHAFPDSQLQPLTKSYQIKLLPVYLTIYGVLHFDDNEFVFKLKPQIIGKDLEDLCGYYVKKYYQKFTYATLLVILSSIIGFFLYRSYKKRIIRLINYFRRQPLIVQDQQDYFKNLEPYVIKGDQNLKCLSCSNKFSNMVFGCGHITVCQDCHNRGEQICKICNKNSNKFMKIYIA